MANRNGAEKHGPAKRREGEFGMGEKRSFASKQRRSKKRDAD